MSAHLSRSTLARLACVALLGGTILPSASPAQPWGSPFGPVPDFRGWVEGNSIPPIPVDIPTKVGPFTIKVRGFQIPINIPDRIKFTITIRRVPMFAATYAEWDQSWHPEDPFSQLQFRLTDVWALNLNPDGDIEDMHLTGFNPSDPEAIPASGETFIGRSGQLYPASVNVTSTLADLPNLLPGLDLSVFSGDPSSIVYVSQAIVPASDIVTPEPSTSALIATGLAAIAGVARRRRGGA